MKQSDVKIGMQVNMINPDYSHAHQYGITPAMRGEIANFDWMDPQRVGVHFPGHTVKGLICYTHCDNVEPYDGPINASIQSWYRKEVLRTAACDTTSERDLLDLGALGLAGESGEVVDLIKKVLHHRQPLNKEKMIKELGDVLWYIELLCHTLGVSSDDVKQVNIDKLRKRYPDGFTPEASVAKADEQSDKPVPAANLPGHTQLSCKDVGCTAKDRAHIHMQRDDAAGGDAPLTSGANKWNNPHSGERS